MRGCRFLGMVFLSAFIKDSYHDSTQLYYRSVERSSQINSAPTHWLTGPPRLGLPTLVQIFCQTDCGRDLVSARSLFELFRPGTKRESMVTWVPPRTFRALWS